MSRLPLLLLVAAASTPAALAATLPTPNPAWNGTWKSDPAKSQTGRTISYTRQGSGFRYSNGANLNFTFACDGKDYPINFDSYTESCKQTSPTTFETTDKLKAGGKLLGTGTMTLSDGGKTLIDKDVDIKPDGSTLSTTTTFQRISGSPSDGLAGTWKTVKREGGARILTYKLSADHVLLSYPAFQETIDAKLDGTPAAVKGPDLPPDAAVAMTLETPDRIHIVALHEGKPFSEVLDVLDPSGKTIHSTSWLTDKENEKTTSIYEKQ